VSSFSTDALEPYVALVGSPNSGKTSLFNFLTGSRQKVANYPGVTVERKEGTLRLASGRTLKILDLPGTYSLDARTLDEAVTRDVLLSRSFEKNPPDLVVAVADATNLERNLNLVLELRELGLPLILALNMMDLASGRGLKLDLAALSRELKIPVFPIVAVRGEGTEALVTEVQQKIPNAAVQSATSPRPHLTWERLQPSRDTVRERYREIDRILRISKVSELKPARGTERLDRIVLHPVLGPFLLGLILAAVFQAVFNLANLPMEWIEAGIGALGAFLHAHLPAGILRDILVEGVLAGVGSVVIFLPQILLVFFFILLLEDSGYMARAAFLMDRLMRRAGLHGRAFIPLLSSFACAIPGIMATRTIENPRDRLITILISPLMACSARLPVYTLLVSAFIPNRGVWGPFRLQGLVMLGLYLVGMIVALLVAWLLKKSVLRGPGAAFLLELPTYKWPNFRNVLLGMWERARLFLRRAGTVILAVSIVVWFLASYPKPPSGAPLGENPIAYSFAGRVGKWMEPAIRPLGFDANIGIGLLTGVVAREVIVGSLATVYSVASRGEEIVQRDLGGVIHDRWSTATGLSLLVFFVFAMQCISTLAVVRRETNSWRWPLFMLFYLTGLAYAASFVTYRLAS
jgi:ferrous iron transport protein B